jgi:UDP-N-acetylmuramyl pentapeptide phosphotransferase/UDP-N-acetylglucosamine-1-phosphate transferase
MDGIDGIAGVQGVIAGLAWTVAGIFCNSHATSFLGSTVAGVCAGFLIHNWAPAKIFMGDVGSAFLGFTFGVLPLVALRALQDSAAAFQIGNLPLFAILVLWPFIGDSSLTFFRRLLKGEPVWQAHRSHLYQRLAQTGWSHARICIVYGVWAAFSAGVGLWFLTNGSGNIWLVAGFPFGSLAAVFTLTTLREKKSLRQAP